MTRIPVLFVGLFLTSCAWVAAAEKEAKNESAPQVVQVPDTAGKEVNGLRLKLKRVPEQWYVVGDQFSLPLAFQNQTDQPFSVLLQYYVPSVEVVVVDEQGHQVKPAPPISLLKNPGPSWHVVNGPGVLPHELHMERAVWFTKPGRYKVWCVYKVDREANSLREPKAAPYHGTVVSNVVELTLMSAEEYVRRAERPDKGDFAGLSMTLRGGHEEFSIRENVQFTATLNNGDAANLIVPRGPADIRLRRVERDGSFVDASPFVGKKDATAVLLGKNETRGLRVLTNREHVRMGLTGPLAYRAELWLRHPLNAAEAAGRSLPPRRVISPEHRISMVVRDGDVESLLNAATASWGKDGNRRRHKNPALDKLCCYLDTFLPDLGKHRDGNSRQASLARDLLLAAEMKKAIQSHEHPQFIGEVGIVVQADSQYRLAPAWLGELNGIGQPIASAEEFAKRFVRMLRCSAYMYGDHRGSNSIPRQLVVADDATMGSVGAVCHAVRQEAQREDVYIYQMELRLPPKTPGGGFIALTGKDSHYSVSMVVGVSPPAADDVRYSIVAYENPDPRPTYFRSWDQQELAGALGRISETDLRFKSAKDLKAHFDSRQKRHEQIWLVPDRSARVADVVDAIKVIRNWHHTPLFVADLPPDAARFAN